MSNLDAFRADAAKWLEENCPPSMRKPMGADEEPNWGGKGKVYENPEEKLWLDRMAAKGWTVPTWPKEYGGAGLDGGEARVLADELRKLHCRTPLISFGITMLGPVLLQYGNEAQKKEHLPKIARGEIRWCQGYSEPGAGSDLAGLQTKCEDKGDHYLVNGQKIWTSYADYADWIFCLVRTDFQAAKHDGISFLLFDMRTPGVSTSPIKLISGTSPFCQTFFQDVKVPKTNLVGRLNGGWTIAKALLQHEREMIGGMGLGMAGTGGGGTLEGLAKEYVGVENGRLADGELRERIAQYQMDMRCFTTTLRRAAEESKAGHGPGAASSIFKLYGTEANKRRYEILVRVLGSQGLGWEGPGFNERELTTTREWLRSKGNSIEGGTSEVQQNIIAKRVLGLPD